MTCESFSLRRGVGVPVTVLDDEGIDYFITPERSGKLFLRTGHSCVGKKKFSLKGVDTDTGKLLLKNPVP